MGELGLQFDFVLLQFIGHCSDGDAPDMDGSGCVYAMCCRMLQVCCSVTQLYAIRIIHIDGPEVDGIGEFM